jgi:hypothetical protein
MPADETAKVLPAPADVEAGDGKSAEKPEEPEYTGSRVMTEVAAPRCMLHMIWMITGCLNFGSVIMYYIAHDAKEDTDGVPLWFTILGFGSALAVTVLVYFLCFLPIKHPKRELIQTLGPLCGITWSLTMINLSPMGSLVDTVVLGAVPLVQTLSGETSQFPCKERCTHWLRFVRLILLCVMNLDFASDLSVGFELVLRQDKLAFGIPIIVCALVFDGKALDGAIRVFVADAATAKATFVIAMVSELPIGIISIFALEDVSDDSAYAAIALSIAITFIAIAYKFRIWRRAVSKKSPLMTGFGWPLTPEVYDNYILEWKRQNLCTE